MKNHQENDIIEILESIKKYKKFTGISLFFISLFIIFIIFFNSFIYGKILFLLGIILVVISALSNKYFSIKKDFKANFLNEKKYFIFWITIEKIINAIWILGFILMISERWITI